MPVFVNLTRSIRRLGQTPTGIDRVELGWLRVLLDDNVPFLPVLSGPSGIRVIPSVIRGLIFSHLLDSHRNNRPPTFEWPTDARLLGLWSVSSHVPQDTRGIYLHLSHSDLDDDSALNGAEGLFRVFYIHDFIPLTHPEYCSRKASIAARARLGVWQRHADAVLTNSRAVHAQVMKFLMLAGDQVRISPPPLLPSTHGRLGVQHVAAARSEFLCVGSIEPRKNHDLLFSIWRRLARLYGTDAPRLHLVGSKGFAADEILDCLYRAELGDLVRWSPGLSDRGLQHAYSQSRALLAPSFAEGYNIPIREALAAGTPVIASDIAAHREAGIPTGNLLSPLDGTGWLAAVLQTIGVKQQVSLALENPRLSVADAEQSSETIRRDLDWIRSLRGAD